MSGYRLYLLENDGHIKERIDMECADDAEAIQAADQIGHEFEMELWCLARVVKKYPARSRRSASG